jgi:pyruvate dehydrogenase E2 component (dihydrolipoamide acetyltransferase)
MASAIQLPALSPTMTEGKITKWLKKVGDKISSGEAVAELETDKSNLEIESYEDGYLLQIAVKEGESAPVGAPIAYVGEKGEKVEAPPPAAAKPSQQAAQAQAPQEQPRRPVQGQPAPPRPTTQLRPTPSAPEEKRQAAPIEMKRPTPSARTTAAPGGQVVALRPEPEASGNGRLLASPLAKRMAQEKGLDLAGVQGSGPQGRIIKRDVEAAVSQGAAAGRAPVPSPRLEGERPEPEQLPISSMRRVIAQRLSEVKPGVPHFYLTLDIEMNAALQIREEAKALDSKVSVNDVIVKASAMALRRVPKMNVSLQGDRFLQYHTVDIGVAVAIEDGLITPVVRDADLKGLATLSAEVRDLVERARRRALKPQEYAGGSLTVSNLGMFGIDWFVAVINPPQASILAVGAVSERPVARGGQLQVRQMMSATLSGDHRVIDGALGAQYLREFKAMLEHPMRLLF